MPRHNQTVREITVQLSTAQGLVFSGAAQSITLRTADGTFDLTSNGGSYMSLPGAGKLTLRAREISRTFNLENATASVKAGRLTVLAETIRELAPESP